MIAHHPINLRIPPTLAAKSSSVDSHYLAISITISLLPSLQTIHKDQENNSQLLRQNYQIDFN
jgi:hypothetical protein